MSNSNNISQYIRKYSLRTLLEYYVLFLGQLLHVMTYIVNISKTKKISSFVIDLGSSKNNLEFQAVRRAVV